jgi:hypothetical protein
MFKLFMQDCKADAIKNVILSMNKRERIVTKDDIVIMDKRIEPTSGTPQQ